MPLFGPPNIERLKARRKTGRLSAALQYQDSDPHKQARIRAQAARALGDIGDSETVQSLVGALHDESSLVRCGAARALGAIGDDRATEPLITALKDRDGAVRREAIRALGRIGSSQAVYPLARLVDGGSRELAAAVIESLGQIAGDDALGCLEIFLLEHEDLRGDAVQALDRHGWEPSPDDFGAIYWASKRQWDRCAEIGEPAIETLEAAINDPGTPSAARVSIVAALGEIGPPAIEPLSKLLNSDDRGLRHAAARALAWIGAPAEDLIVAVQPTVVSARLAEGSDLSSLSDELAEALHSADGSVRDMAVDGLRRLATEPADPGLRLRAIGMLVDALEGDDPPRGAAQALRDAAVAEENAALRAEAARLISRALHRGPDEVRSVAAEVLQAVGWQPDTPEVRAMFAILAGEWDRCVEIGAPAAVPLSRALATGDWKARRAAARKLGEIGGQMKAGPQLKKIVASLADATGDRSVRVRKAVVQALRRIGGGQALSGLWQATRDSDEEVRRAAYEGIAKESAKGWIIRHFAKRRRTDPASAVAYLSAIRKNPKVIPTLISLLEAGPPVGWDAAYELVWIGKRAGHQLAADLKTATGRRLLRGAWALGMIGDDRATPYLTQLLIDSPVEEAGWRAAEALDNLGWQPDTPEVEAAYAVAHGRWGRCATLGSVAVDPLLQALKRRRSWDSAAITGALGKIGDSRAVPGLLAHLRWTLTEADKSSGSAGPTLEDYMFDDSPGHSTYWLEMEHRDERQALQDAEWRKYRKIAEAVAAALTAISGEEFGIGADRWEAWWEAQNRSH